VSIMSNPFLISSNSSSSSPNSFSASSSQLIPTTIDHKRRLFVRYLLNSSSI
jgi:hypothetical protein